MSSAIARNGLVLDRIGHGLLLPIVRFVLAHDLILLKRLRTNAPKWEDRIEKAFNDIVYRADPDLAAFAPKEETRLSFRKLVPILKEIDDVLVEILQDLATTPDLARSYWRSWTRRTCRSSDSRTRSRRPRSCTRSSRIFAQPCRSSLERCP